MCTDGADVTKYKMSRLKEWWEEMYKDGSEGLPSGGGIQRGRQQTHSEEKEWRWLVILL